MVTPRKEMVGTVRTMCKGRTAMLAPQTYVLTLSKNIVSLAFLYFKGRWEGCMDRPANFTALAGIQDGNGAW